MFSRDALAPAAAAEYLAANLDHPRHRFLPDAVALGKALSASGISLQGHQQTTDAYLFGLALHHDARLASLDRAFAALLPSETKHHRILEIVGLS
jgi:predicted nucleic acid-binding protein